ncbi:hypothetical protein [Kitasatospora sp. NPDC093806]|uniref:hypothetical protein n=1 Tax=Kitasatospora sp. NPDC093806 TaxID=3155075 RepID=UPI0034346E77
MAGGSALLSAPAAFAADDVPRVKLKLDAPAVIGSAGQPVEFTETVTNTGSKETNYRLYVHAITGEGLPASDAIVIDYRDPAGGGWKSLKLSRFGEGRGAGYGAELPKALAIPAHRSVAVKLRIGLPMGRPHAGATNGGIPSLVLDSGVAGGAHGVPADRVSKTIKVQSPSPSVSRVPATAVAGGAPIEFDAVVKNSTPSNYVNVGNVLFVDPHATVQVRKPNGTWTTLKKVYDGIPGDNPGVYLQGRDSSLRANSTTTVRVRVSYDTTTPLGQTKLGQCLFVNESPTTPFRGTTSCGAGATVQIVAPGAKGTKGTNGQPPVKTVPGTKGSTAGK